mgnify:CR=1 FL=1
MNKEEKNVNRRDFLFTASYTVGAVGLGAVIWPLIDQMNPDKAQQALATTEVDISQVEPGKSITVLWRGKPVFLKRRTSDEIAEARAVSMEDLPDPQRDEERVKDGKDEWLVMLGVCTHLGCTPNWQPTAKKFKCPCHGSGFRITGIHFEGPAPRPLERFKITLADDGEIIVDKNQKYQQEKGQW